MKLDKNIALKLQNFAYHLGLASKNLTEAIEASGLKEEGAKETKTEEKTTKTKTTKGKAKPAEEEMEEVESQFSDDPADFDDADGEEQEEKPAKGKGKSKPAPKDDDNFDFDDAEVEEEQEPEHTEADVRSAMTAYAKKHSKDKALAVLGKFAKSKKVTDVPPAKYGALIDALKVK